MLGDKLGEERGKITGRRVLPSDGGGPRVETSFEASGKLLGIDAMGMGTYWSVVRPDGTLYGEGQGVVMGQGGEMASWTGQGVGKFTGPGGAVSFRGALYYQTASAKWARLSGVAVVFEYEVDASGQTHDQSWEWK